VNRDPEPPDFSSRPDRQDYERGGAQPAFPESQRGVQVQAPSVAPIVTYTLLVITVLVFLAQEGSRALLGFDLPGTFGMKVNEAILEGELWRLFTPMFLHGSVLHIGFNMYALHLFGPGLERHFGHWRFLMLYFLAGFAGNVTSMMFSPFPSLGSSTAIFGLLGAQGVFIYRNREIFGGFGRRALNSILMIAAINLIIGLNPGIDNWGHMGGLVGGTLFTWLGGPILKLEGMFASLKVVDSRESRESILAGLGVGAIFLLLTAATIYFRTQ
jgi:rhomboid protease GluP